MTKFVRYGAIRAAGPIEPPPVDPAVSDEARIAIIEEAVIAHHLERTVRRGRPAGRYCPVCGSKMQFLAKLVVCPGADKHVAAAEVVDA